MGLSAVTLKTQQRENRAHFSDALNLRVHRAISWLTKAEQCDDLDSQFIFYWIAFNSAYANEMAGIRKCESEIFNHYLARIIELDGSHQVYHLVWDTYSGAIRVLLENPYVYQKFWDSANGLLAPDAWKAEFEKANKAAHVALAKKDTTTILSVVFSRLYTLRNQLVHGGATWNSKVNRDQLRDACHILKDMLPLMIKTMLDHPEAHWGEAIYPPIS